MDIDIRHPSPPPENPTIHMVKEMLTMEIDPSTASSEQPFNAIDFIALYRIAERNLFRTPQDRFWEAKLREAQDKVIDPAWRHNASMGLDEKSRQILDLFLSVL